jgi:predicted phage terminase large subunit-like protein
MIDYAQIQAEAEARAKAKAAVAAMQFQTENGIAQTGVPSCSLKEFTKEAWHVLEPTNRFKDNWHIDAICEHLTACTTGEIQNIIINIPPRFMKSLLVAVFWFAWTWTFRPGSRWLFSSYSDTLSTRDSLKSRRLITSPWYLSHFPDSFVLTSDQNVKTRFENDKTGYRIATGVGGLGTGEGGDFIVVDDPHKVLEAESDAQRQTVHTWWDETMTSRVVDPATSVQVIVMQRIHDDDLTGHTLKRDPTYAHLCLPMEYEAETANAKNITPLGFQDPRSREGELLFPERFPQNVVDKWKVKLGAYAVAGQLQQRPVPRGGLMFKRVDFVIKEAAPLSMVSYVRYWDKAGTHGGGAYTAGVLMARDSDGFFWILDVVRGQWSSFERKKTMKMIAALDKQRYGAGVQIWHEQEPGSGGKESAEITNMDLAGYIVHANPVSGQGSKEERADAFSAQVEAGNVRLLEANWNEAYLTEAEIFPKGQYKDQIDASSGAFTKIVLTNVVRGLGVVGVSSVKGWGIGDAVSR